MSADGYWRAMQDTEALRGALPGLGLVAFVGNGAILPRLPLMPCHSSFSIAFCVRPCYSDVACKRGTNFSYFHDVIPWAVFVITI